MPTNSIKVNQKYQKFFQHSKLLLFVQSALQQDLPLKVYNIMEYINNKNRHYVQIDCDDLYKIIYTDKVVKDSYEFVVLMTIISKLNLYQSDVNKNLKMLTAKKIYEEIKEIRGGKQLLSYSKVCRVWKELIRREIIFKDEKGLVSCTIKAANVTNSRSYLRVGITTMHRLLHFVDDPNELLMSYYFLYRFGDTAFKNKFFRLGNQNILNDVNGKIKSDSTLFKILKKLETKKILIIKRAKPNSRQCNEYTLHPYTFDDQYENYNTGVISVQNTDGDKEQVNADSKSVQDGPKNVPNDSKSEGNCGLHNKEEKKRNSIIESSSQDSDLELTSEGDVKKDSLNNKIENLMNLLNNSEREGKTVTLGQKLTGKPIFKLDLSDDKPVEKKIDQEEIDKKQEKDRKTNYFLINKYKLSDYAHVNINRMRDSIKKYGYFKDFNHNKALCEVFRLLDDYGGWPFNPERREIKLPYDQYLTLDKDQRGMIFEKVLMYYRHKLDGDGIKFDNDVLDTKYLENVQMLQHLFTEYSDVSDYDKIRGDVYSKLSDDEISILNNTQTWHVDHENLLKKINNDIYERVNERVRVLKYKRDKKLHEQNVKDRNYNFYEIKRICEDFDMTGFEHDIDKEIRYQLMYGSQKSVKELTLNYLKRIAKKDPKYSDRDLDLYLIDC